MQTVRRTTPEGTTDDCGFFANVNYLILDTATERGKTYVISFYIYNDTPATKTITLASGSSVQKTQDAAPRTWNYISIPFVANGEVVALNFQPGAYYIYKAQLEKGTTSTPWTQKESRGLNFPFGFPFDYSSPASAEYIINKSQLACNAILMIYGPAENPSLTIGANEYKVNATIYDGEYLTIDTKQKTVTKTTIKGDKINLFSKRDKEHYIFEKIQPGKNAINITPKTNYSITLIDERSEPAWT